MTCSSPDLRSRPPLLAAIMTLLLLPFSPTGGGDRVQAWVTYPERSDPASAGAWPATISFFRELLEQ